MELIHTIYQPAGSGPFPTILTLHGRGANALDLLGLAPMLCGGKFLMICPQGPLETPIGPEAVGYAWYPMSMGGPPNVDVDLVVAEKLLAVSRPMLEALSDRSQEACRTRFQSRRRDGPQSRSCAPRALRRTRGTEQLATERIAPQMNVTDAVQSLPTLVQHGTQDPMIEVDRARDSVERLRALRVPLTYREYEMGHEIRPRSLSDLSAWLEEKFVSPIVLAG